VISHIDSNPETQMFGPLLLSPSIQSKTGRLSIPWLSQYTETLLLTTNWVEVKNYNSPTKSLSDRSSSLRFLRGGLCPRLLLRMKNTITNLLNCENDRIGIRTRT